MSNDTETTRTEKGLSLARVPALIVGTVLLAAGLYFIYKQHTFPKFAQFPNGPTPASGKVFLGIFAANGWTGMLSAVAGGLLLFGAAAHLLAKAMSLIVGVALGAAAIIALSSSGNVLGMAAANGFTELLWGACAAVLLFNTLIPRRRRTVRHDAGDTAGPPSRQVEPTPVRRQPATAAGTPVQQPPDADAQDTSRLRPASGSPNEPVR